MSLGQLGTDVGVDFKNELVAANNAFIVGDFQLAAHHYCLGLNEIERQQRIYTDFKTPPKLQKLITVSQLSLAKCYDKLNQPDNVISYLQQINVNTLGLQTSKAKGLLALAYRKKGYTPKAIEELESAKPFELGNFEQDYVVNKFNLATLYIELNEIEKAKQTLLDTMQYLEASRDKVSNEYYDQILSDLLEDTYHLSIAYRCQDQTQMAIDILKKGLDGCFNSNKKPEAYVLLACSLFHCYVSLARNAEAAESLKNCLNHLDFPKETSFIKIKFVDTYIQYIKILFEMGSTNQAIISLNQLLTWSTQTVVPDDCKHLFFSICTIAANLYLQPNSLNPTLAMHFLNIANRHIKYLPSALQLQAQFELTLMKLICHHHLNEAENAEKSMSELVELSNSFATKDFVATTQMLRQLLPLFPQSNKEQLLKHIKLLTLQLAKSESPLTQRSSELIFSKLQSPRAGLESPGKQITTNFSGTKDTVSKPRNG